MNRALKEPKGLYLFDPALQCILLTDVSKLCGLWFIHLQEGPNGKKHIIKFGSVLLKPAQ